MNNKLYSSMLTFIKNKVNRFRIHLIQSRIHELNNALYLLKNETNNQKIKKAIDEFTFNAFELDDVLDTEEL